MASFFMGSLLLLSAITCHYNGDYVLAVIFAVMAVLVVKNI